jgi:glycosyltransferase involved in cell wall biosynthesis
MNVCVLISAYNGEQYIEDQILSVLKQRDVKVSLVVRDDGSTDRTSDILKKYENRGDLIMLPSVGNIGPALSFFELLKYAPDCNNYFSFCDQDDIWDECKLARAVMSLIAEDPHRPTMYFSRQEVVDENLNKLGYSDLPRRIGFGNALVECITPGCTVVINALARNFLIVNPPSRLYMMHDWWIYLTLTCFGNVIYDPIPCMKYRQHINNVVGLNISSFSKLIVRWKRFRATGRPIGFAADPSQQAVEFKKIFDNQIPPDKLLVLNRFVSGKTSLILRIRLAFSSMIWRQRSFDDLLVRLLIVLNRY